MAIYGEFFKHQDFGGYTEAFTLSNSWRYYWIKFGGGLRNEITSLRARAHGGYNGHVYGFTGRDFNGDYAALDMAEGWTCWWSNVGGALNDDIESALMINRNRTDEIVVELKDQIADPFKDGFDDAVAGTQVSRRGDPKIYAVFWPSFDSTRKFVRIEQDLRVAVDWWPDYDARVRYDVYLYLQGGEISGYVAWTHTWVEGGIFSGKILDDLHPKLVDGASDLTAQLQDQLALLNLLAALGGISFQRLYYVPGREPTLPPPSSNFGHTGNLKEDATLVLTH